MLLALAALAESPLERRLYSDDIESSSFLWNDWNRFQENYHPLYVMDGDPATAWVEGAATAGVGEWIRLDVSDLEGATRVRLRVRNGYQKSPTLFKANARPKQVSVTLLPAGVSTPVTLTDTEGWQEVTVAQPSGPLDAVEIRVDSVYPGTKYTDLCLSDIEVYATAVTRDNPAVEKARLDRVLAWKRDRIEAAAIFKTAGAGQIPLAPGYTLKAEARDGVRAEGTPYELAAALLDELVALPYDPALPTPVGEIAFARDAYATRFAGWAPVQAVAKDTRRFPVVDGLKAATLWNCYEGPPVWSYEGQAHGSVELPAVDRIGFLRADGVGTFDVKDNPAVVEALEGTPRACETGPRTLAWAKTAPATDTTPARLQALLLVTCGQVEAREGMENVRVSQLLVYDADGRMKLLVTGSAATVFGWKDGVITDARRVGQYMSPIRVTAR